MYHQGRPFFFIIVFVLLINVLSFKADAKIQGEFVAGEYVIELNDQVSTQSLQQRSFVFQRLNVQFKNTISEKNNLILVERSMIENPEKVLEELNNNPLVRIAEPNYIYRASLLPNDSRLTDLWGLVNNNKNAGGIDIDAAKAWDITTGSRNVVVAVIDTGVNYNDPDLKNNMWINTAEKNGLPGVDDDGNGYIDDIYGYDFANNKADPMDDNNHGSHCAGTIGAEGNNGIGVVGVNWKVKMMALKFLKGNGGGTLEGAIKAIDYATDKKVDIMNNSWGGGGVSQTLREAIERAEQAGILFVAAAGNNRSNNDIQASYPASYDVPNVVSVAAIGSRGELASFSNYGKKSVHIAAPGVDILSTGKSALMKMSGTSMAAPHVSGIAALILADNSNLNYEEIKQKMYTTATQTSALRNRIAYGIVNAYHALTDTIPAPDMNDPSQWAFKEESVSTSHPYEHNLDTTQTLTVEGAEKVAVYFSRFDTERGFDKVTFYDKAGNLLGEMSGPGDDSYSPVAIGDSITLRFVSDQSINRYGFDITKISYVMPK